MFTGTKELLRETNTKDSEGPPSKILAALDTGTASGPSRIPIARPRRAKHTPPKFKLKWHNDNEEIEIITPPPEPSTAIVVGITTPPRPTIQWNPKYSGSSDVDLSLDDPWTQEKTDFGSLF